MKKLEKIASEAFDLKCRKPGCDKLPRVLKLLPDGKPVYDKYCRGHQSLHDDDKRIRRQIFDGLTDFTARSWD